MTSAYDIGDSTMTEFSFKVGMQHESRCGWCLDWIVSLPESKPDKCPYCGSDLSTRSPRYDEMMGKIERNSEMRQRDNVLKRLRRFQFQKKHGMMDQQFESIRMSPLVGIVHRMFPVGKGTLWSGGMELMELVEYIHLNPNSPDVEEKKKAVLSLGMDLYKRGVDAMELEFSQLRDELTRKYTPDFDKYRSLWNGICDEWKY